MTVVHVELSDEDTQRLIYMTVGAGVTIGELVTELLQNEYERRGFPPPPTACAVEVDG